MEVASLAVLIPPAFVPCQYQVSVEGAEPVSEMVIPPAFAHNGELDVGISGVAGDSNTVITTSSDVGSEGGLVIVQSNVYAPGPPSGVNTVVGLLIFAN